MHMSCLICRVQYLTHNKLFIPGYDLHECLQVYPTYNGLLNSDGCTQEYLIHKIEAFERMAWKAGELIDIVNTELYSMKVEHDCGVAWDMMKELHGLCKKMCRKYTEFDTDCPQSKAMQDTLQCVCEVKAMLEHLKFCARHNPRDTVKPASINVMMRLLRKSIDTMESFLQHVWTSHPNTEAE